MMRALLLMLFLALPAVAQTPLTLRGGGLEVAGDFSGWQQQPGAGVLHGNYYRLGLFYKEKGPALSLLIDEIPRDRADLDSLCNHSAKSWKSVSGLKILEPKTFAGKVNQKWLEIHYSAPDG